MNVIVGSYDIIIFNYRQGFATSLHTVLLKTMRTTSAIIAIFLRLGVPGNCDGAGHRYDRDPVPTEQWVGRMAQWR